MTTRRGKSHNYRDAIFSKSSVFKLFFVHAKTKEPAFSNSSGMKSVFEKLRFRDGLVRTVGLTGEIKLRFQFSLAQCGRNLIFHQENHLIFS